MLDQSFASFHSEAKKGIHPRVGWAIFQWRELHHNRGLVSVVFSQGKVGQQLSPEFWL